MSYKTINVNINTNKQNLSSIKRLLGKSIYQQGVSLVSFFSGRVYILFYCKESFIIKELGSLTENQELGIKLLCTLGADDLLAVLKDTSTEFSVSVGTTDYKINDIVYLKDKNKWLPESVFEEASRCIYSHEWKSFNPNTEIEVSCSDVADLLDKVKSYNESVVNVKILIYKEDFKVYMLPVVKIKGELSLHTRQEHYSKYLISTLDPQIRNQPKRINPRSWYSLIGFKDIKYMLDNSCSDYITLTPELTDLQNKFLTEGDHLKARWLWLTNYSEPFTGYLPLTHHSSAKFDQELTSSILFNLWVNIN
jgi:hypothetical protein